MSAEAMTALRLATLALVIAAAGVWIYFSLCGRRWLYCVPILMWSLNAGAFLATRIFCYPGIPVPVLNSWSLAIQGHAAATLVVLGLYLCYMQCRRPHGY